MNQLETFDPDQLVRSCTVFGGWAHLAQAMEGGYVPTVRPISQRHRDLILVIESAGYEVIER